MKLLQNCRRRFRRNCLLIFSLVVGSFLSGSAQGQELGRPEASKTDWRWQSDQPGFHPNLTYPILYTLTLHGASLAFITSLDSSETGYTVASFKHFRNAFTKGPVWDDDGWCWNYLAHPFAGSEIYLRARAQGCSAIGSFLFGSVSSTVWEFGVESWYERPSYQDLIITPIAGAFIGEARFRAKRALLERNTRFSRGLAVAIDPLQSFAQVVGHAFGQDWREPAFSKVPVTANRSLPIFTTGIGSNKGNLALTLQCSFTF